MQDSVEFYYRLENLLNDIIVNGTDIPYIHGVRTIGQAGFEIKTGLTENDVNFEYILILLDSRDYAEIVSFKALFQSYDSLWDDIDFTTTGDITNLINSVKNREVYAHAADKDTIYPGLEVTAILFEKVLALCEDKADA